MEKRRPVKLLFPKSRCQEVVAQVRVSSSKDGGNLWKRSEDTVSFPFKRATLAVESRPQVLSVDTETAGGYHSDLGEDEGGVTRVGAVVSTPSWLPCYSQFVIVIILSPNFSSTYSSSFSLLNCHFLCINSQEQEYRAQGNVFSYIYFHSFSPTYWSICVWK